MKSCVCPRSEQRAGKPACINHTSKCPITNRGGNFETEARAAKSRYPGHTAGGKSSWAGMTRQSLSWLSQLFLCPVTRPHILLSKPSGATLPPAPQPPSPCLMSFLETGLMGSEQVWPGTTARGNLSTEPRGLQRLLDLYQPQPHGPLNRELLLQCSRCLQTSCHSVQTMTAGTWGTFAVLIPTAPTPTPERLLSTLTTTETY